MSSQVILLVEDNQPVDFYPFAEVVRQLGMYWLIIYQQPPKL